MIYLFFEMKLIDGNWYYFYFLLSKHTAYIFI